MARHLMRNIVRSGFPSDDEDTEENREERRRDAENALTKELERKIKRIECAYIEWFRTETRTGEWNAFKAGWQAALDAAGKEAK
jgi:hypothetical protein